VAVETVEDDDIAAKEQELALLRARIREASALLVPGGVELGVESQGKFVTAAAYLGGLLAGVAIGLAALLWLLSSVE
jgi:hypothetical protein